MRLMLGFPDKPELLVYVEMILMFHVFTLK